GHVDRRIRRRRIAPRIQGWPSILAGENSLAPRPQRWLCSGSLPRSLRRCEGRAGYIASAQREPGSITRWTGTRAKRKLCLRTILPLCRELVMSAPSTPTYVKAAAVLMEQGDLAGARPLYERALAIRKKANAGHAMRVLAALATSHSRRRQMGDRARDAARP